jgi:hypothetical protein
VTPTSEAFLLPLTNYRELYPSLLILSFTVDFELFFVLLFSVMEQL